MVHNLFLLRNFLLTTKKESVILCVAYMESIYWLTPFGARVFP